MVISIIFSVITLSLFITYSVGYIRKSPLLKKISYPLIFLSFSGILIPLFIEKLPDSQHVMVLSSEALFFAFLLSISSQIDKFKRIRFQFPLIFAEICFWVLIFASIFYFFNVHTSISVIFAILCFVGYVFFLLKFQIKKIRDMLILLFEAAISFSIVYIAFISLLYSHKLYSILIFLGSLGLPSYLGLKTVVITKDFRFSQIFIELILLISTALLYAGAYLIR